MDENASKYTNAIDDKKSIHEEYVKKYKTPLETEDWIKLSLPKEFLDKVKTLEDYNFMSSYMF